MPHPPIIMGAQVEAAIKRAAKIGDGWLLVPVPTLDQIAPQMSLFKATRAAAGLAPSAHICRLLEVGCAPDEDDYTRDRPWRSSVDQQVQEDVAAIIAGMRRAQTIGSPAGVRSRCRRRPRKNRECDG